MRMRLIALCGVLASATLATADLQTFGFDDGTFQGWAFTDIDGEDLSGGDVISDTLWVVSDIDVDLGENGWALLQGSTEHGIGTDDAPQRIPNHRIIPEPWGNRDCISLDCISMLVSSPTFKLDTSGPISVDIVGGSGMPAEEPIGPGDLAFKKNDLDGIHAQGFALYDIAADEYVEYGYATIENDGKEKDGRGVWETVEIPAENLAQYAGNGKDYRVDVFDSLAGGWGWIGFDTVKIPNADYAATGTIGDCDGSGTLDAADLVCVDSIEGRDAVLSELGTVAGDLDGNGAVEFADFLTLSGNFGTDDPSYAAGNIDLMGGVEFADFLTLSGNFGLGTAAASSVPEPSSSLLALIACLGLLQLRSRNQR